MTYLEKILIGFDQFANTIFDGYPDETLSARAYRLSENGSIIPMKIIDAIFFFQKDHCYEAYLSEVERKQFPKDYRD